MAVTEEDIESAENLYIQVAEGLMATYSGKFGPEAELACAMFGLVHTNAIRLKQIQEKLNEYEG